MATRNGKIKVLYLVNSLEMGGAERVVVDLVNGLPSDQFQPAICCLRRSGPCAERIQRDGVEVIEMGHGEGNNPFLPMRLSRMIRARGIDVVHSHGWGPFCEGVLAARWGGASVIIHTDHGRVAEDFVPPGVPVRLKKRVRYQVQHFLLRWVDRLVVVSEYLKELIAREMGPIPSPIITLANGISFPQGPFHREETRRALGFSENNLVILSVGRLARIKNYRILFEVAPKILREVPQARFVLAGDGPERQTLEELRRSSGLESVATLLGERNNVPELLAASDLFVLPSDFEATSMSLLEAMAAGLPVVATRVGGNPFIVTDRETGLLIPPRDSVALSKEIISLLHDPISRREMGKKGAEKARILFSREKMLSDHAHLYRQLLEEKRRREWGKQVRRSA